MAKRIEFISLKEFQKLYKSSKDKDLRLIMMLGFGSGLRISEIIGLKDWNSKCCDVEVEQKKVFNEKKNRNYKKFFCTKCQKELEAKDLKYSDRWKINPLTKDKIDLDKHQIRIDEAKGGKWRVTIASPGLKPEMIRRLPITIPRRTLQHRFESHAKKVLKKKMSIHILRHGFGNHMVNDLKLSLPMVQGHMGHSSVSMTGEYAKANPEQSIKETWGKMNE